MGDLLGASRRRWRQRAMAPGPSDSFSSGRFVASRRNYYTVANRLRRWRRSPLRSDDPARDRLRALTPIRQDALMERMSPSDRSALAAERGPVNMAIGGVIVLDRGPGVTY